MVVFAKVEARESLVDRSLHYQILMDMFQVEARESLVDRSLNNMDSVVYIARRGSREPCGSKSEA